MGRLLTTQSHDQTNAGGKVHGLTLGRPVAFALNGPNARHAYDILHVKPSIAAPNGDLGNCHDQTDLIFRPVGDLWIVSD